MPLNRQRRVYDYRTYRRGTTVVRSRSAQPGLDPLTHATSIAVPRPRNRKGTGSLVGGTLMTLVRGSGLLILLLLGLPGCQRPAPVNVQEAEPEPSAFTGSRAGEEREVAGIKLCWCPPG